VDEPFIWGSASVTYTDWIGTAALDQRRTGPQLEEIVGLDPDEWMVIGLDIGGGETSHDLRVLAVPNQLIPETDNVLPKIAQANDGAIPVTEFLVHDVDPYEILRKITHVFELRLRMASTENLEIKVVERGDV
jgi:hypothetical protein